MFRRRLLVLGLSALSIPAFGADPEFSLDCTANTTCQQDFEGIMQDASAALNFKSLGPAEATGITGIGIAAFVSYVPVENEQNWRRITGTDVDAVGMAGIIVRKGLPFNIDVGAFYSTVPGTGADVFGGEVKYAILEGGVASPALAVRGTYVATSGIEDFDYTAWGADVSLSKGFALVTPYIGAGFVSYTADPNNVFGLQEVEDDGERIFIGMRIGLALIDIIPEYERVGDNNSYNLLLGLSF